MAHKFLLNFIAASSIGVALPSNAANFATFSQVELIVSDFNILPQDVGVVGDVKQISIEEVGTLNNTLEADAIFVSNPSIPIAFAYSRLQTSISGTGGKVSWAYRYSSQSYWSLLCSSSYNFEL